MFSMDSDIIFIFRRFFEIYGEHNVLRRTPFNSGFRITVLIRYSSPSTLASVKATPVLNLQPSCQLRLHI